MRRSRLSQFEQQIARFVEGSMARLFADRLQPHEVATQLAHALEDNANREPDGVNAAPNLFTVLLHPDDHSALTAAHPNLTAALAESIVELTLRAGMRLADAPNVHLQPDPQVPLGTVQVTARHTGTLRATQSLQPAVTPASQRDGDATEHLRNAQLIIQGSRYVALDRPVINIGRRQDNHIVIDDPHVSRTHAQIRLRFGRRVLYDLGSRGGTFVNNHRITESILNPGDVISLAGVMLIYIEDEDSGANINDTRIRPPSEPMESGDPTL